MKITRSQLSRIIREEARRLVEGGTARAIDRAVTSLEASHSALLELLDTVTDNEVEMNAADDDSILAQHVQGGISDIGELIELLRQSADDANEG